MDKIVVAQNGRRETLKSDSVPVADRQPDDVLGRFQDTGNSLGIGYVCLLKW